MCVCDMQGQVRCDAGALCAARSRAPTHVAATQRTALSARPRARSTHALFAARDGARAVQRARVNRQVVVEAPEQHRVARPRPDLEVRRAAGRAVGHAPQRTCGVGAGAASARARVGAPRRDRRVPGVCGVRRGRRLGRAARCTLLRALTARARHTSATQHARQRASTRARAHTHTHTHTAHTHTAHTHTNTPCLPSSLNTVSPPSCTSDRYIRNVAMRWPNAGFDRARNCGSNVSCMKRGGREGGRG
jgi:hypothetical protein